MLARNHQEPIDCNAIRHWYLGDFKRLSPAGGIRFASVDRSWNRSTFSHRKECFMGLRGFRHEHDYLREPKFRRWKVGEGHDLLPWADPYIASLFHVKEDEDANPQEASSPTSIDEDEEENTWRR